MRRGEVNPKDAKKGDMTQRRGGPPLLKIQKEEDPHSHYGQKTLVGIDKRP